MANASLYIACMLDELRAWLNGSRDYYQGILLYDELGDNEDLKALFAKGKTDYCNKRLQVELMSVCNHLKSTLHGNASNANASTSTQEGTAQKKKQGNRPQRADQVAAVSAPAPAQAPDNANPELFKTCKLEADHVYKEAMNARAVLFAMVPANQFEDPNRQDLVAARKDLALQVVSLSVEASRLYDRADFVRINGKLPDEPAGEDLSAIADHLVKNKLDNLRKNLNKIKGRELTSDRLALIQRHQADIITLEARWLSLKPTK
ncbi:MAG: hypothetical protein V4594_16875 [Bacteroidota bacterium]